MPLLLGSPLTVAVSFVVEWLHSGCSVIVLRKSGTAAGTSVYWKNHHIRSCQQREKRMIGSLTASAVFLTSSQTSHSGEESSGLIDARIRTCRRREGLIDKTAPKRR